MIDHIEIMEGDSGWPHAAPLLEAVWPAEVVATLPWRDVVWSKPDQRLLGFNRYNEVICHAAIVLRDATWDDRAVKIGGIGGVATREDSRRRGVGSTLVRRALKEIDEIHRADFGLLFCEPRHAPLYLGLGWHPFEGHVFVVQPAGRGRFTVTTPTCSISRWLRAPGSLISAACLGDGIADRPAPGGACSRRSHSASATPAISYSPPSSRDGLR